MPHCTLPLALFLDTSPGIITHSPHYIPQLLSFTFYTIHRPYYIPLLIVEHRVRWVSLKIINIYIKPEQIDQYNRYIQIELV